MAALFIIGVEWRLFMKEITTTVSHWEKHHFTQHYLKKQNKQTGLLFHSVDSIVREFYFKQITTLALKAHKKSLR